MASGVGAKEHDDTLNPAKKMRLEAADGGPDDLSADSVEQDASIDWLAWLAQLLNDRVWFALYEFSAAPGPSDVDAAHVQQKLMSTKRWPLKTPLPDSLVAYAQRAVRTQTPLQISPATEHDKNSIELSAIPLRSMNGVNRVLCVAGPVYTTASSRTAMIRLCQWAAAQLKKSAQPGSAAHQAATANSEHILAKVSLDAAMHRSQKTNATALSNALLEMSGCQRVSIGVGRFDSSKLLAISGQATLDGSRQLSAAIAGVMRHTLLHKNEESIHCWDAASNSATTPALTTLYALNNECPIASIKIESTPGFHLLVVLESPADSPLLLEQLQAIQSALKSHANLFEMSARSDATWIERLKLRYYAQAARYKNQSTRKQQQLKVAAIAVAGLLALFPIPHKVSGTVSIEAADRQVIVAPQKGHVASAHARAGDLVTKGQLLATLDGRDLQLDVDKWNSEKAKNAQAYAKALATHDRTELSRLRADAARIDAELQQVEQNLNRSELRAPMDGVLLSGDLSQALGAPVESGSVLFEVGSTTRHRLIVKIDEADVGYVKPEQTASIRMAALPSQVWQASLETVQPVAVAEAGASHFRLPATMNEDIAELRPGMEGVARIKVGSRSSIWVLTHKPLQQVRYWLWRLGLSG